MKEAQHNGTMGYKRLPVNRLWLIAALALYLALAGYQLGLPGLHYDEAREAGVNAMEILTGAPVTLFRDTGISLFGRHWPVMVQDYIGSGNIYLALPFLWLTGIGVPNLRVVALLIGLITLLLVERTIAEWQALGTQRACRAKQPLSTAGLLAVTLLVASPSFVFWSRQGIFVTTLTEPLVFAMLWQGIRWLNRSRRRHLLLAAFWGGCALYAKLLAIWVVGPFALLLGGWWVWRAYRDAKRPPLPLSLWSGALLIFFIPLMPLLWFNGESGGTISAVTRNLETSYYGVDNLAVWSNLRVRVVQFQQMVAGEHLWYLGGLYGNSLAWWLTIVLLVAGAMGCLFDRRYRNRILAPLLLLSLAFGASLFTLSDLFVTHYALLQPLTIAAVAFIFHSIFHSSVVNGKRLHGTSPRGLSLRNRIGYLLVALWLLFDLTATIRYHRALTTSGGLADHSDASYHLAYYLQYNGLGAPIALDWGFDAPIRYLSSGTVTPIEIFGYESPQQPDAAFVERLQPFLANPSTVYLLHAPQATIFQGRREEFLQAVRIGGQQAELETVFRQRDGTALYELWRLSSIDEP